MTSIDSLYEAALTPGPEKIITASMAAQYVDSPFGLFADLFAPIQERDPPTLYQELLLERGQLHESEVLLEAYPEAAHEPFQTEIEGFREALELMAQGAAEIYAMPLMYLPFGIAGRPDVLVKVPGGNSRFGDYHYEVVEIKLAKTVKPSHIVQSAFYCRLVGVIQDFMPQKFHVVNGERELFQFEYMEYESQLNDSIEGVHQILSGTPIESCYGAIAWPWENYGNKLAVEKNDVSLIPGVGPTLRASLKDSGFATVADVNSVGHRDLQRVKSIGAVRAENFSLKAKAICASLPVARPGVSPAFEQKSCELYLDLEGTDPRLGTDGLPVTNYLIGVLFRDSERTQYIPFFAHTLQDEKRNLEEFCRYVGLLDDFIIYHWHHYERVHLQKMFDHYEIGPETSQHVMGHLVDPHPMATKSFAFPSYSDGLKAIAGCLGFKWRQDDVDAMTSVVLYLQYLESKGADKDAASRIITYNEDDCLATMFVKDWLNNQTISPVAA